MKIYDIDKAMLEVEQRIDDFAAENDGLIPDDLEEQLELLGMERATKIENVALLIKNVRAESEAIKAEEKTLKQRRLVAENKYERLLRFLESVLSGEKFSSARVSISYRKSASLEGAEDVVELLPKDLVVTTTKPDKVEIKRRIKAGETFKGIELVEKQNIQIK